MSDNLGRIFAACAALAGLWILVYWLWEPSEPRIRFDPERPGAAGGEESGGTAGAPFQAVAVVPPSFRDYTVQAGDTLQGIAARELGSARYAEAISRANPFLNFETIRPGRVIKIPRDPGNIQGVPVAGAAALAEGPAAGPAAGATVEGGEYTVKSGDTLSRIARAHYGSVTYAELIFQANRDRLRNEHELQVGQKLRLPARPQ
jgi:nucleoid-associated protein YgaU